MKRILLLVALLFANSMAMAQNQVPEKENLYKRVSEKLNSAPYHSMEMHAYFVPVDPLELRSRISARAQKVQEEKLTEEQLWKEYVSKTYEGCNKGPCEIAGNDCRKVADLVYAIFRNNAIDMKIEPIGDNRSKFTIKIKEPYQEQLDSMNLHIVHFGRMRDGGSMDVRFADGTIVVWPNGIGDPYRGEFLEFRSSSPMGPIHFVYSVGEHPAELVEIPEQEQSTK